MSRWENPAAWYDVLNPWGPSDDFYLGLVMSADRVLDVGCGTGRLLHRARDLGHTGRLCRLDPDAAMLDQARARTTRSRPAIRERARGKAGTRRSRSATPTARWHASNTKSLM